MHRIDGAGATSAGLFTEGDPRSGAPATTVTADWLNSVQEELAAVVEGAGMELDKVDNGQVRAAIRSSSDGWRREFPAQYLSASEFLIQGAPVEAGTGAPEFHPGRRVLVKGRLTGLRTGIVTATDSGSGSEGTRVAVVLDEAAKLADEDLAVMPSAQSALVRAEPALPRLGANDHPVTVAELLNEQADVLRFLPKGSVRDAVLNGDYRGDLSPYVVAARDYLFERGGGKLILPRGRLRLNVALRKWIEWEGQGEDTLVQPYHLEEPVFRCPRKGDFAKPGTNPYHLTRWGLQRVVIDGRIGEGGRSYALDLAPEREAWVDRFSIEKVLFRNIYRGVRMHGLNPGGAHDDTSFVHLGHLAHLRFEPHPQQKEVLMLEGVILETAFQDIYIGFKGSGASPVTIKAAAEGSGAIKSCGRLSFDHLVVDRGNSAGACVTLTAARGIAFRSCYFEAASAAVVMNGSDVVEDVSFTDCVAQNYRTSFLLAGPSQVIRGLSVRGGKGRVSMASPDRSRPAIDLGSAQPGSVLHVEIDQAFRAEQHLGAAVVELPPPPVIRGATPSIAGSSEWELEEAGIEIVNLTGHVAHHPVTITVRSGRTPNYILSGGNFVLSRPWCPRTPGDSLTLKRLGGLWREVQRVESAAILNHATPGASITIDPSGYSDIHLLHRSKTIISDFSGVGVFPGQELRIVAHTPNSTIRHGGRIALAAERDLDLVPGRVYRLVYGLDRWFQG